MASLSYLVLTQSGLPPDEHHVELASPDFAGEMNVDYNSSSSMASRFSDERPLASSLGCPTSLENQFVVEDKVDDDPSQLISSSNPAMCLYVDDPVNIYLDSTHLATPEPSGHALPAITYSAQPGIGLPHSPLPPQPWAETLFHHFMPGYSDLSFLGHAATTSVSVPSSPAEDSVEGDADDEDMDPEVELVVPPTHDYTYDWGQTLVMDATSVPDDQMFPIGLDNYDLDVRHNFDVRDFFFFWRERFLEQDRKCSLDEAGYVPPIDDRGCQLLYDTPVRTKISVDDLDDKKCNLQGINLAAIGVTKAQVQQMRRMTYRNHTNILPHGFFPLLPSNTADQSNSRAGRWAKHLPISASLFRFRQMHLDRKAHLSHFQLRHLICASSKNAVFMASSDRVLCADLESDSECCIMDFSKPCPESNIHSMQRVTTLTARHDILVAGGFKGDYALKSLLADDESPHTLGTITHHLNGITNHVHTFLDRRSGLPRAVFSNNDSFVRVLDCQTNRFVHEHDLGWAVNCTATSPDTRLRLIVGDSRSPWIVDAESGDRVAKLPNHTDFGFACAWSSNGYHMATGNQDRIVQVWDARKWNKPLHLLATDLAGVRAMEFSPLGGGPPTLALAEPADFVSVVDAQLFEQRQRFEFLGEIGGVSFVPDGSKLFVAVTDDAHGGLVELDRLRAWSDLDGGRGPSWSDVAIPW